MKSLQPAAANHLLEKAPHSTHLGGLQQMKFFSGFISVNKEPKGKKIPMEECKSEKSSCLGLNLLHPRQERGSSLGKSVPLATL